MRLAVDFRSPYTGRGPAERPNFILTIDLAGGSDIFAGTGGLSGSITDAVAAVEQLTIEDFSEATGQCISWTDFNRVDFVVQDFRRQKNNAVDS